MSASQSEQGKVQEVSPQYLAEASAEVTAQAVPAGYKLTEVGVIPEDWRDYLLGELCDVRDGTHDSPRYRDMGVPLVTSKNIVGRVIDLSDVSFISEADAEDINKRSKVDRGDIIMSMIGTVGAAALVRDEPNYCIKNVALFKPKKISTEFLFYYIEGPQFQAGLDGGQDGGIQKFVSLGTLRNIRLYVPRSEEQTAIANALSDVDALIGELEKLIAKKQAIKTATMQQLLTGRTRLPAFAHHPSGTKKGYKQTELGEIPEDWEVISMGEIGSTFGGLSGKGKGDFGSGNSLYVPFTNVMANVVVDVERLDRVEVNEAQNNVRQGDLLFNGSSETPEEVCFCSLMLEEIDDLYLNSFCFGFRSNPTSKYSPLYLAYWFRSVIGRSAVSVMAQGSTRYNISKSQFLKLGIVLPSKDEQAVIATTLSDMDTELHALEQRLNKTRQIKQGMMQELLTGKTRLI